MKFRTAAFDNRKGHMMCYRNQTGGGVPQEESCNLAVTRTQNEG